MSKFGDLALDWNAIEHRLVAGFGFVSCLRLSDASFHPWAAEHQPLVRAMLLTSSRAIPNTPGDVFSDYDVILALLDVHPFYEDRTWLEALGSVLVLYRDPLEPYCGCPMSGYVTQYENGLKIDFALWPVELLQRVVADPHLPDELDAGHRVLLDAAKHLLNGSLKQEYLRPMLEWRLEIDHQWSVKPGPYGRQLKKWLRPDLWTELESTYTGARLEANWEAMFRTIALFRQVAIEVGDRLGYSYPGDLDRRAVAYLHRVKNLERGAESLL